MKVDDSMDIDIEGLKEFKNTVEGFVNSAEDYTNLKKKVANQRKQLNQLQNKVNDLKASQELDGGAVDLRNEIVTDLENKNDQLIEKNRKLEAASEQLFNTVADQDRHITEVEESNHDLNHQLDVKKSKLVALNHILDSDSSDVELR